MCCCADTLHVVTADSGEQVWKVSLTVGRVVNSTDIPTVSSRPGGPCNDIAPYYGAHLLMLLHRQACAVKVFIEKTSGNPTSLWGCAPLNWTAGGVAGITSTPVIDPVTDTVYVMSYSVEGATVDSAAYRCTNTDSSVGCLASSGGC